VKEQRALANYVDIVQLRGLAGYDGIVS